jgi:hypothetical protein
MALSNSSGPFSRKTPKDVSGRDLTNPSLFGIASRLPKDDLITPELTRNDIERGDLRNLYISPVAGFRNTSYTIGWRTMQDLSAHSNFHVTNGTFGTGQEGLEKLRAHMELMYSGLLAGMSFKESHQYAIKHGPAPVNE